MSLLEILGWLLVGAGLVCALLAAIGMLRFPDFYTRMHAASVADTLAAGLVLGGLMLLSGIGLVTFKLLVILVFLLFTSPVASHVLAQTAQRDGYQPGAGDKRSRHAR